MTAEEQVARAAGAMKVFPLPSAVLFPHTAVPLHIFEPRYRAMLKDALASDRVIALCDLAPGWETNYHGRPRLRNIGCAGTIVWHEALPDGRYNVVLHGVSRYRMIEELPPSHAYREVRAELIPERSYDGPLEEMVRQEVLEIAGRVSHEVAENLVQLAALQRGGALADVVAAALVADVDKRQQLLRELDPGRRLEQVLEEVAELMARIGAVATRGPLN